MRYLTLACDYDGTLARDGVVDEPTLDALERLIRSGRHLLLVTGRRLPDLQDAFPRLDLAECVVAENGGLLYWPSRRQHRRLAEAPPGELVDRLRERGVDPLAVGDVVVATWEPHEQTVLETIHELGLEMQVIFNKGAVMVLPTGVNKASGLAAALDDLDLSPHNVVGVGDAENDHAFLGLCECAVAVANALPAVRQRCDLVTEADHGAGVVEVVERLLSNDLGDLEDRLTRHHVLLGERVSGDRADKRGEQADKRDEQKEPDGSGEVRLPPYGVGLLVAGPSGSGKSTLTTAFLERLAGAGYQFCLVDPEGDYDDAFPDATVLGDAERAPAPGEVGSLLERPGQSAVVNLLGIPVHDRPAFFEDLLPGLQRLRSRLGHPHWLVVDEAHHLLPSTQGSAPTVLPRELGSAMLISVHPESISPSALAAVEAVAAVGDAPRDVFAAYAERAGHEPPPGDVPKPAPGEFVFWRAGTEPPVAVRLVPGEAEHARHQRKYAAGTLAEDRSFYFRGPDGRLNLRAHNLMLFVQIGEGVDDDTWLYHLGRGDYSRWVRGVIGDPELADEVEQVEHELGSDPERSRARVRELVEERYTLPADPYRLAPPESGDPDPEPPDRSG